MLDNETLPVGATYLPVTMKQFEELTNELLIEVNKLSFPHAIDGNYMAKVVMQCIHGLDHKHGMVSKRDLLLSCINRISNNVTFYAVEEMNKKLQKQLKANENAPQEPKQPIQLVNDEDAH